MQVKNVISLVALIAPLFSGAIAEEEEHYAKHGKVLDMDGTRFRWHQIGKGIFTGIPEDEFDENVHTQNDEDWGIEDEILKANNLTSLTLADIQTRSFHELEERDFLGTVCRVAATCYSGTLGTLGHIQDAFGNAWAQAIVGPDPQAGINRPFYANLFGVGIQGLVNNLVNIGVQRLWPAASSQCSSSGDLGEVVKGIMDGWKGDPNSAALSATITVPNGGTFTITVAAAPGNTPPPATCDPNGSLPGGVKARRAIAF